MQNVHRFGDCVLDVAGRELRRSGELLHLEPQAFDLLVHLLEHRDRVVSKIELLDAVWGHRFVSDANLTTRVKEARRSVGDDGTRQEVIRNVRGRGYRFVAPVEDVGGTATTASPTRPGLIGRDAELVRVVERVGSGSLVTIVGPGGVGKSALARAVAAELGPSFEEGDHTVELAALDTGADVALAVARALDVILDGRRPDDAMRSIARLRALLVLDNCEHVVDEVAALVERLTRTGDANLRIVATSQVRLGLGGEAVVTIAPLSLSDASALFLERARAVAPGWSPRPAEEAAVGDLVSRLDRLPLTIEMAASRLGSMSFGELHASIADDAVLLRLSHRTPAQRHRSLGSMVAWSTDMLDSRQRSLFQALSVFAGRVTAADAAAVVVPDDPNGARFDLASLAERSFLMADRDGSDTTYSMLMTMRAAASRELDESGRAEQVRRRHAVHVRDVLGEVDRRIRTPDEAAARQRLASVVDEARVAFRWAADHDRSLASEIALALHHASYSTLWLEPAEWCRALSAERVTDVWGARAVLAGAAIHRGELEVAQREATSIATASELRLQAVGQELLADVALYSLELERARRAAEALRHLGEQLDDAHFLAAAAVDTALARSSAGDPVGALAELEETELPALAPTDAAWVAYARGDAMSLAGDPAAVGAFQDAIELGSTVGSLHVVSISQTFLAMEHLRIGEHGAALTAYASAVRDCRRHANYVDASTTLRTLAELLFELGEDRGATILAAATDDYTGGPVTAFGRRIAGLLDDIRRRVGADAFAAWTADGERLAHDDALEVAAEMIALYR